MSRRRPFVRSLVSLALVAGGVTAAGVVTAAPASAATLTVNTTTDQDQSGACSNASVTVPPNPLSLRAALCVADNMHGSNVVIVPAGTYQLTLGELKAGFTSGTSLTIVGAGAGSTRIVGDVNGGRVLEVDPFLVGGVTVSIDGVTITGGHDSTYGGAGIIGGKLGASPPDSLTVSNSVITDNHANDSAPNVTNNPGGGIQFAGGNLTISNSTISNNSSKSSPGAGVFYQAGAAGDSLTITNSTFDGNQITNSSGTYNGGAGLAVASSVPGATMSVTGSIFSNNTGSGTGELRGGAIASQSGALTLSRTTFRGNSLASGAAAKGGAVYVGGGTATAHYNRIVGNTANGTPSGMYQEGASTVDASLNWWGCNAGPGNAGCDGSTGTVVVNPRLVLSHTASPASVATSGQSTLTASLLTDSGGNPVSAGNLTALTGVGVSFGGATLGSLSGSQTTIQSNGTATSTFTAGSTPGNGGANATVDNQTVFAPVTVTGADAAPTVTLDPTDQTVIATQDATFTADADGQPTPTVKWQVSTDGGATFTDVPGATSKTLTFMAQSADDGNQYRAVFTNSEGSATTAAATLSVQYYDVTSSVTVDDTSVPAGDPVGVTLSATNSGNIPAAPGAAQITLPYGNGIVWSEDGTSDCIIIDTGTGYFVNCATVIDPGATASWHLVSPTTTASCGTLVIPGSTNGNIEVTCNAGQTISWDAGGTPPASAVYGSSFPVSATATSGLPVTISVSGPCSYDSGTGQVTVTGTGADCVVKADQAGGSGYDPAPQLSASVATEAADVLVTVAPPSVQYSDVLPSLTGSYVVSGLVPPDTLSGTLACTVPSLSLGAGNQVLSPAGAYPLSCSGLSNPNYSVTYAGSLTVTEEDATVGYTGPVFVAAASASATSAPVTLTALVEQAQDGHLGDLTHASVDFLLYKSGNVLMSNPDIEVLDIPVSATGVASFTLPAAPLDTYTVVVRISPANTYFTGPSSDAQVLTVFAPTTGKWATGGGWVHDPSPTVSPTNDHGSFGFAVRYKKGSSTPLGQSVYVWRGNDGYDYIVKSNSWKGGGASFGTSTAGFSGKATVIVYDPATGTTVSGLGGGNFTYRVDVTDGSTDKYAISVYTPKGALYHRAGTTSTQLPLGGGNITVHH